MSRLLGSIAVLLLILSSAARAQDAAPLPAEEPTVEAEALLFDEADSVIAPEPTAPEIDLFAHDRYQLRPLICPFKGRVGYDDEKVSCAALEVPENRTDENSRMIELIVITLHAEEPDDWKEEEDGAWEKRDDPLIYLIGGPGGQIAGTVGGFEKVPGRTMRDLILLEQRGIGYSDDFCPYFGAADPAASNTADFEAYLAAVSTRLNICFEQADRAGVDLQGYNNEENARDLVALRRALGLESWNVWGISYGSTLALQLLRIDDANLRSVIIDGIAPIVVPDNFFAYGYLYDRALGRMQEACNEDEACADNFPAVADDVRETMKLLMSDPVEVSDPLDKEVFPSDSAWIFHDAVGGLGFFMLYAERFYEAYPATMSALRQAAQEGSLDERMRIITAGNLLNFGISEGMYTTVACQLGYVEGEVTAADADAEAFPVLPQVISKSQSEHQAKECANFGMTPMETTPLSATTPTLVVNGAIDPITPPEFAKAILPGFEKVTYIEVPYAGHGPTGSEDLCSFDLMRKFLDDPNAEVDGTCLTENERPAFWGPLWRTKGVTALTADTLDEGRGAMMLIGLAVVLGLSFLMLTAGTVSRLLNPSDYSPAAHTGGARIAGWVGSLLSAGGAGVIGAATFITFETSPITLLVGLPGWAMWGSASILLGGLVGLLGLIGLVRNLFAPRLPLGTFFGLFVSLLAMILLAVMSVQWGFVPWA